MTDSSTEPASAAVRPLEVPAEFDPAVSMIALKDITNTILGGEVLESSHFVERGMEKFT